MSKTVRALVAAGAALALCCAAVPALAQAGAAGAAFDLITPAEAQQAQDAERTRTRSLGDITARQAPPPPKPGAPGIRVLTPAAPGTPVAAPLRIEVAFTPQPGARIVPGSFRVLYGLLKIDLTERLRQHATVTEQGVVVDRANVPDGQHRLILQVADDKGNLAEQELRIRVGSAS